MAGDRLVDGVYQPVTIVHTDATHHWGHSEVLNLDLCWEDGELRWWNPTAKRYLRTSDEESHDRIIAENERDTAQAERDTAEARAQTAEARTKELEEELRYRRDQ